MGRASDRDGASARGGASARDGASARGGASARDGASARGGASAMSTTYSVTYSVNLQSKGL